MTIETVRFENNERVEGYNMPKFQHEIPSNCSSKTVVLFAALYVNELPTINYLNAFLFAVMCGISVAPISCFN
jgi:hypothetical protein